MPVLNLEIRDLPVETNRVLNALAGVRGCPKWRIIREALIEYAVLHEHDIRLFSLEEQSETPKTP